MTSFSYLEKYREFYRDMMYKLLGDIRLRCPHDMFYCEDCKYRRICREETELYKAIQNYWKILEEEILKNTKNKKEKEV